MKTLSFYDDIKGSLRQNVVLSPLTWFRVGGKADVLFVPQDEEDLSQFIKHYDGPIHLLGAGSNLLVSDEGVAGAVVKLGKGFHQFIVEYEEIEVGAGLPDRIVSERCQALGLSGFEFLFTIPGNIGGALFMNAGCYGAEMSDRLISVWAMDPQGIKHRILCKELHYRYRHCGLPEGWIFLSARFRGISSNPKRILETMMSFEKQREETQPLRVRTGGSTFANPERHKAWQLIDQIGYRGKRKGGACVSETHCNFLINEGSATAEDLKALGEEIRQKVWETFGVDLTWEIRHWGF